jgi:hypothetical protein
MSRPTKLNAQTQAQIIKALEMGATRKDAAESSGVDYRTFLNWYQWGEEKKRGKFFQFFQQVKQTESDLRAKLAGTIIKAGAEGDWRASQAYLRMRDPDNWIEKTKLEITTHDIDREINLELARVAAGSKAADVSDVEGETDSGEPS